MLYACTFLIGFATGIGVGAFQASTYLTRNRKEESRHE
jgi:hypothetical protein